MLTTTPPMRKINARKKPYKGVSFFAGCGGSSTGHKMAGIDIMYANEFIPAARKTYRLNHPTALVDGRDVRKVKGQQILDRLGLKVGELDLMDMSPPCFVAGTLITTASGLVPIEQIAKGTNVTAHSLKSRKVIEPMVREYKGKMHTVKAFGALPIVCTPEHPFYVRKGNGTVRADHNMPEPAWVDAKDLEVGDRVGLPINQNSKEYKWLGIEHITRNRFTKEVVSRRLHRTLPVHQNAFWWVVGRWLGDGWLRHYENTIGANFKKPRHAMLICCDKTDGGKEMSEITKRLDLCGFAYRVSERRTVYRISVSSKELVGFLLQFNRGAENKQIPGFVLDLPVEKLKRFMAGYLSADGHKVSARNGHYRVSTVSRLLAVGVTQALAKCFGIACSIHERQQHSTAGVIEGRAVVCKPIYVIEFRTRGDASREYHLQRDGFVWVPVRSIGVEYALCKVYNFSVDVDESYVANNVCVHNCKSFSTAGTKDKGWGEVSHYSDGVHQRTDDLFFEAARLVTELKPKVFVAENVAGLAQGNAKGYFLEILKSLEDCGYKVSARVLNAAYLGVPQARERIIFVGVRNDLVKMGFKPVHPDPLPDVTTVREKLPHIRMLKSKKRGMLAYVPSDIPSPTIVASDGTNSETAGFSSGGFIEDKTGERRKYNLKELREVFSFPQDFQLYGNFKQKWERLGRSVPPLMMYHVTRRIISDILKPYYELRATGKAKIKLGPGLKQITTDANVKKAKKKTGESKIKAELADLKKTVRKASKKLAKNTGMDVAEFSKQLKKLGKERTDKAIKTDAKKLIAKGIRKGVEAAVREAKAVKTKRGRN